MACQRRHRTHGEQRCWTHRSLSAGVRRAGLFVRWLVRCGVRSAGGGERRGQQSCGLGCPSKKKEGERARTLIAPRSAPPASLFGHQPPSAACCGPRCAPSVRPSRRPRRRPAVAVLCWVPFPSLGDNTRATAEVDQSSVDELLIASRVKESRLRDSARRSRQREREQQGAAAARADEVEGASLTNKGFRLRS